MEGPKVILVHGIIILVKNVAVVTWNAIRTDEMTGIEIIHE